jgi:hypothetical protein
MAAGPGQFTGGPASDKVIEKMGTDHSLGVLTLYLTNVNSNKIMMFYTKTVVKCSWFRFWLSHSSARVPCVDGKEEYRHDLEN